MSRGVLYAVYMLILFAANTLGAVGGFGAGLISIPFLTQLFDTKMVVMTSSMTCILNLFISLKNWDEIDWKELGKIVFGMLDALALFGSWRSYPRSNLIGWVLCSPICPAESKGEEVIPSDVGFAVDGNQCDNRPAVPSYGSVDERIRRFVLDWCAGRAPRNIHGRKAMWENESEYIFISN